MQYEISLLPLSKFITRTKKQKMSEQNKNKLEKQQFLHQQMHRHKATL